MLLPDCLARPQLYYPGYYPVLVYPGSVRQQDCTGFNFLGCIGTGLGTGAVGILNGVTGTLGMQLPRQAFLYI